MFLFHYHRFHRFIVYYVSTSPYQHPPIITALKQKKYKCFFIDLPPLPPTPLLYEDKTPYIAYSPFKNFIQTLAPPDHTRSNVLFCLMILWS